MASCENTPPSAPPGGVADEEPLFKLKELVEVSRRKFPGFNYEGGTAKITKIHDERVTDLGPMKDGSKARTTGYTYAVKYVMGGSEKRVDAAHITAKSEVSREEASEARQKEVAAQKAERERVEALRLAEEKARLERKRAARTKLTALRAAKKEAAAKAAKRAKPAAAATCGVAKKRKVEEGSPEEVAAPEEEEQEAAPQVVAAPAPVEDKEEVKWLRTVLGTAPRDCADELDLDAFLTHALGSSPLAVLGATEDAQRQAITVLLRDLEADNHVMLVDNTIFLV